MTGTSEKRAPSEPSVRTIKRLYGESGNLCAFPNCEQPLISGQTVLGKVCHIKGSKYGSPRYDAAQSAEERHGYNNVILMCGVHHDVIDKDEKSYTVERLHEIKGAHLKRAASLSDEEAERGALLLFSTRVMSVSQSGGITAASVTVNNFGPVGYDEKGKAFSRPQFPVMQPREGNARFRKGNEPLGMIWDQMPLAQDPPTDVALSPGKAVWLRLIPTEPLKGEFGAPQLKAAAFRGGIWLRPFIETDLQFLIADDGFGICDPAYLPNNSNRKVTGAVAFAFGTGEIWGVDTHLLGFENRIIFGEISDRLIRRFRDYATLLENLGIQPPYRWIAGLEGLTRMTLDVPARPGFSSPFRGPACVSPEVAEAGLYEGTEDASTALSPLFDKLFMKCGIERPEHLRDLSTARLR